MINLDLSKIVHPRLWDLLPAFMPGLFFEICVFLGQPERVDKVIGLVHLERYLQLIIAVLLAFIIGNAFMLWVRTIQLMSGVGYTWYRALWPALLQRLLRAGMKPSRFTAFVSRAASKAQSSADVSRIQAAWQRAATQVLKHRYGITLDSYENVAWSSVLGSPKPEDYRGLLGTMAAHATGWSGLAAAWITPSLRTTPYFVFTWFLVIFGVFHDWSVARRWNNPTLNWLMALRSTLREIPRPATPEGQEHSKEEASGTDAE